MKLLWCSYLLIVLFSAGVKCHFEVIVGEFGKTYNFIANYNTSKIFLNYTLINDATVPRINLWSNASLQNPVLVTVAQEHSPQILFMSVPLFADSSKASRTLCRNFSAHGQNRPSFFIAQLSTFSSENINFSFSVNNVSNFFVTNETVEFVVTSRSQPNYFLYQLPRSSNWLTDIVTVGVNITSYSNKCLRVPAQRIQCPVYDLDEYIPLTDTYGTVNTSTAFNVNTKLFPNGFFLIFIPTINQSYCYNKPSFNSSELAATDLRVVFTITTGLTYKDYIKANAIVLLLVLVFCVFGVILVLVSDRCKLIGPVESNAEDTQSLLSSNQDMTVDSLSRNYIKNQEKSSDYFYHVLNIALFYGIPTVQLMVVYQKIVNFSGNQDLCYYNFPCANPILIFGDFNHIYSNIGYVFTGILFLGVVKYRSYRTKNRSQEYGVPTYYGVFYAMGMALINEGILSGCYHVCPSENSFQFDTSFMYVIAVLCMIKLYENRHSDVSARAYTTCTLLGFIILIVMAGLNDNNIKIIDYTVETILAVVYIFLTIYVSVKIYCISVTWNDFVLFLKALGRFDREYLKPKDKKRFWVIVAANIINYCLLIAGMDLFLRSHAIDFGSFLLMLLLGNAALYAIIYTSMKIINKEGIGYMSILYGIFSLTAWGVSMYFFVSFETNWSMPQSTAETLNQKCFVFDFYDKHDVWHLLSAVALYFSFMYLLSLDDNVAHIRRDELAVF